MSDIMSHCFSDKQETDYRNAFDKTVLYKQTTEKAYYSLGNGTELPIDVDRFCGLSMYLPQSDLPKLNDWYKDLDWYKAVYE
ncbi:MAG: hypothetical protein LIP01_02630 [Tannerellaceae bacterium]|nr:hypothetical protein [Tannerellaceae bacterium]